MINNLHIVLVLLFVVILYIAVSKSSFNPTLSGGNITDSQPRSFPAINQPAPVNANQAGDVFKLETPECP